MNTLADNLNTRIETSLTPTSHNNDPKLWAVCREFEQEFMSALLKEGLKAADTWNDSADGGSQGYRDMVYDQLGKYVGGQGMLGLADQLYNQLNRARGATGHVPSE